MTERLLVPINQQLQINPDWSQKFGMYDRQLCVDNPRNRFNDTKTHNELTYLGGAVLDFTGEFDRRKIPEVFDDWLRVDVSLGAKKVRLTTGERVTRAMIELHRPKRLYDEDIFHYMTGSSARPWVFAADSLRTHIPQPEQELDDNTAAPKRNGLWSIISKYL